MAILTSEAQAAMNARFAELNAQDSTNEVQQEDSSGQNTVEVQQETREQESEHSEKKIPESVPYSRFQKEIQKRKSMETELQFLKERVSSFETQTVKTPQKEKSWLDDLLNEDKVEEPQNDRYSVLESRVAAFEQAEAEKTLTGILNDVSKSHPDMPQQMVLAAISNGKSVDDAVNTWENLKSMVLKNAGHTETKAVRQAPTAAPVLKSSGIGKAPPTKPKTLEEAHAAMNSWLKSNL